MLATRPGRAIPEQTSMRGKVVNVIKLRRVEGLDFIRLSLRTSCSRSFATLFFASLLIFSSGCKVTADITDPTATPTPTPRAVTQFVVAVDQNASQNSIKTFNVGSSGALTLAQTYNTSALGNYAAGHPTLNYVYVLSAGGNAISSFAIASDGTLTELSSSPINLGNYHEHFVLEPKGRFLFSTQTYSGNIDVLSVNQSTGALTFVSSAANCGADCVGNMQATDTNGKFLYVAAQGQAASTNGIYSYAINQSTGTLTALSGSPYLFTSGGNGPYGLTVSGDGKFLVSGNTGYTNMASGLISGFSSFSINSSTGQITYIGSISIPAGASTVIPFQMTTDAAGHIYAADSRSGNLLSVSLSNTGVPTSTSVIGSSSFGVAVDLSGKYIYGSTESSSTISQSKFTTAPAATALSPATVSVTTPVGLGIATYR